MEAEEEALEILSPLRIIVTFDRASPNVRVFANFGVERGKKRPYVKIVHRWNFRVSEN